MAAGANQIKGTEERSGLITDNVRKNPLRIVIRYAVWIFFTLLIIYLLLNVAIAYLQFAQADSQYGTRVPAGVIERAQNVSDKIETITRYVWDFFVPFLQLALLFLIIDWLLTRFGIDVLSKGRSFDWNIQTVIALIVISAFAIAALAGLNGVGALKDVALVVVGFYFGSQKRRTEIETGKDKIKIEEEHENPITLERSKDKGAESGKGEADSTKET